MEAALCIPPLNHMSSKKPYACDEQRLSELYDESSFCGKQMVVIRWNPDAYAPAGERGRVPRQKRLALFVALKRALRAQPNAAFRAPIVVLYMFYDRDSDRLCRNLPYAHVDAPEDVAVALAALHVSFFSPE